MQSTKYVREAQQSLELLKEDKMGNDAMPQESSQGRSSRVLKCT